MIKAVLLDLDNTLLVNPDAVFAREYLQRLELFFLQAAGFSGASQVIRRMIAVLTAPRTGIETNLDMALQIFAGATGQTLTGLESLFDEFYAECYPTLRQFIQPVAGAAELIDRLRTGGLKIIIATNPIYPSTAIHQRMAWANVPDEPDLYTLVTTADVMHFAKPDAAYYAEILARAGVEPDEALMVGDSITNDIHPAHKIGIHTFQILHDAPAIPEAGASGTLADFASLITAANWRHQFPSPPLAPAMIEPQYRGNIGALFGMLTDVLPDFWHKRPITHEWSILQLLCHLVDSEASIQRPRLERILREDNPFIVAPHPPGPDIPICADDGFRIAQNFVHTRQQTINFLQTLQPEDWLRPARHSIFGLTTLLEMAHFTAQHDRLHLNQLCQTIGRCYA